MSKILVAKFVTKHRIITNLPADKNQHPFFLGKFIYGCVEKGGWGQNIFSKDTQSLYLKETLLHLQIIKIIILLMQQLSVRIKGWHVVHNHTPGMSCKVVGSFSINADLHRYTIALQNAYKRILQTFGYIVKLLILNDIL